MSSKLSSPAPDVKALLDAANEASKHVSVLHIAFMALCAYILVIVFGTKDLDLLIGKGVKLPVVDVEVPIVGFYASAPLLIVLVHFNLLLQLQLLSHKLYIFDAALSKPQIEPCRAPSDQTANTICGAEAVATERDLLDIFPYTHYLIGCSGPLVRPCLGMVVGATFLVLPLATLLLLQLRFLAYQSPIITWFQRMTVWLDVAIVVALWPVIIDSGDNWFNYMRDILRSISARWVTSIFWTGLAISATILLFHPRKDVFEAGFSIAILTVILYGIIRVLFLFFTFLSSSIYHRFRSTTKVSRDKASMEVKGAAPFLLAVTFGVVMPLALVTAGEALERSRFGRTGFSSANPFRHVVVRGEVLLAKAATPELVSQLRVETGDDIRHTLNKVEKLNLANRSLRHADLSNAILSGADFSGANLEGALFDRAHLESAGFYHANLNGASFESARLDGAILDRQSLDTVRFSHAHLEGASLENASLAGANLEESNLDGARLLSAYLVGANLSKASLEGANLSAAQLQGADLSYSHLDGATFRDANLVGADLSGAQMNGVDAREARLYGQLGTASLIDLRYAKWATEPEDIASAISLVSQQLPNNYQRQESLRKLKELAAVHLLPHFDSCIMNSGTDSRFSCTKVWSSGQQCTFQIALYPLWEQLACRQTWFGRRLLLDEMTADDEVRLGFLQHMAAVMDDAQRHCDGLHGWTASEKRRVRDKAKDIGHLSCVTSPEEETSR